MKKTINELASENVQKFMEDGPRLRSDYNIWVVARDKTRKRVLLGGLGGMGCGQMWSGPEEHYKDYPGFEEASEEDSWGEFGTSESWKALPYLEAMYAQMRLNRLRKELG